MKVKNVSRQPLCVQGQSGGIHLMPGEVRTVKEGDLAPRQTQTLLKQGLLQVITNYELQITEDKKSRATSTRNSSLVIRNSTDQREATHG